MTRHWALLLALPVVLVWQMTPLAVLPVLGWRLDPTLVLVVAAGLVLGPPWGLAFGLLAGAGQDLLVGAGVLYTVTKALAGMTSGLLRPHLYQIDSAFVGLVGLLWTLGEELLVAVYSWLAGRTGVWDHFAALSLPLGLAHAVLLVGMVGILLRLPPFAESDRAIARSPGL